MNTLLLATVTTTFTLTANQLLLFQILVYIGATAVVGFILYSIAWLIEKLTERKLYDEQQIELIVQKAKIDTIKEIQDRATFSISEKEIYDRIKEYMQKQQEQKKNEEV